MSNMIPTMSIGQKFCLTLPFVTGNEASIILGGVPTWTVSPASLGTISSSGSSASFISKNSGYGWIRLAGVDSTGNKISKSRFIHVVSNSTTIVPPAVSASTGCPGASVSTGLGFGLINNTGFGAPPGVTYGLKSATPVSANMLQLQGTPTYGNVNNNFGSMGVTFNPFSSGYPVNPNYANPYQIVRYGQLNAPANYLDQVGIVGNTIPGRY